MAWELHSDTVTLTPAGPSDAVMCRATVSDGISGQEMKYVNRRRVALLRRKTRQAKGKIRRWLLDKFRKEQIEKAIAKRRGECRKCGQCCRLVFKCPFLQKEGSCETCKIYKYRPAQCRHFPIDKNDLRELGKTCGYYFVDSKDDAPDTDTPENSLKDKQDQQ
jgi:hypothetical protein